MTTLFISDLHLCSQQPKLTELFFNLTKNCQHLDALYILGDLFEYWIGDNHLDPWLHTIKKQLHDLSQADLPIYLMPGNRDFLLTKHFAKQCGAQLITDPHVIELYGQRILLTHGDRYTLDRNYQYYRKLVHLRCLQSMFLKCPLAFRGWLANKVRAQSVNNSYRPNIVENEPLMQQEMQNFNTQILIYGHIHQAAIRYFPTTEQTHYVLSDWQPDRGNLLVCKPHQSWQLVYFDDQKSLKKHLVGDN